MEQQTIEQRIAQLKKITLGDGDVEYSQAQVELGEIYYFDLDDWQQAESYFNKVKEDDPQSYAIAQYQLGLIYLDNKDNIEAESYFNKVKEDDPQSYARAQFCLGLIYRDKKDNIEAESYFNKVKEDDPQSYAIAQFYLGLIYQDKKDDTEEAESYFKKVRKEDHRQSYARAQFCLGLIYRDKKDNIEEAESYFKKVEKEDDPKSYAQAQLYLGYIYLAVKDKIEEAELYFKNVEKQSDFQSFAKAQSYLGYIYQDIKDNIEEAELYFKNVEKQSDFQSFARAQFSLGLIYQYKKNNIEKAELYYKNVEKKGDPKVYARAQYNLGFIYYNEKHNIEKAESYYKKIEKKDDSQVYAKAQYNLGLIYYNEENNIKNAKLHYLKVKKEDDLDAYVSSQLQLGKIYFKSKQYKLAETYYQNIERNDDSITYFKAQTLLGIIYQNIKKDPQKACVFFLNCCDSADLNIINYTNCEIGDYVFFNKTVENLEPAKKYYQRVVYSDNLFVQYVIAQIMLTMINNDHHSLFKNKAKRNKLVINPICKIRELTEKIQKQLLVTFKLGDSIKDQQQQFERQVAHYTRAGVLFNLLKKEPSDFRLNVIDFMNDPTENQVLTSWLGIETDPNNDIKSFLASFSFNHNSLNQFRLYGNENNIVGSSVSMVFNQQFFCDNAERSINAEAINLLSEKIAFQKANNDLILKKDSADSNDSINQNNTTSIYPLPLFRCLYFDPNSEYISMAKRSKFSFYLEHQGCPSADIEKKWAKYIKLLDEQNKIKTIRKLLNEIKEEIKKLKTSKKLKVFTNLDQLINLALMPISCLIKHAAFEDEDECRIIYITHIDDEKIQVPNDYALANSLFMNYNKVEDFLEKIYLGPQCPPYHKLWITNHFKTSKSKTRSKAIKVVQSEMPLR